jgi:hypothetical protein
MKKLILLSLMMLLSLPFAAYAMAPNAGPSLPGLIFSLDTDYTANRDMKPTIVMPAVMGTFGTGGCHIRHLYRTMLQVGYGLFDFLEVYVKLGGAGFKFRTDIEDQFGSPVGDAVIHTNMGFAYGGGVKATYEFKDGPVKGLFIGADAQVLRHAQRFHAMTLDNNVGPSSTSGEVTLTEWQIGPFVGYRVMNFLPYVGVKYSDVRLKFTGGGMNTRFRAEDHFGG